MCVWGGGSNFLFCLLWISPFWTRVEECLKWLLGWQFVWMAHIVVIWWLIEKCRPPSFSFTLRRRISVLPNRAKYSHGKKDIPTYNKTLCKWGHFEKAKTTFKMLLVSWFLMYFFKRFRSIYAKNLGSAGQKAAKLLAVKVGGLKKKSAGRPRPHLNHSAHIRVRLILIILKIWWLVTLQPFDLQTPNFQHERSKSFKKVCKKSRD